MIFQLLALLIRFKHATKSSHFFFSLLFTLPPKHQSQIFWSHFHHQKLSSLTNCSFIVQLCCQSTSSIHLFQLFQTRRSLTTEQRTQYPGIDVRGAPAAHSYKPETNEYRKPEHKFETVTKHQVIRCFPNGVLTLQKQCLRIINWSNNWSFKAHPRFNCIMQ